MGENSIHPLSSSQEMHLKFGTDGIRGRVGKVITADLLLQLGYWVGHALPNKGPVLIGKDSRSSGSMITAALTEGLTASGKEVWDLGLCPTPAVAGLVKKVGAAGGLMISASHNPPEDNGVKVFGEDGSKLNSKQQKLIEKNLREDSLNLNSMHSLNSVGKAYNRNELLKHYRDALIASVKHQRLDKVRIVLDLCWGSATAFGKEVFEALGADLTVLHGLPNGRQINVGCGSTNLEILRKEVLNQGAEMGFAFDGDADRMMGVDSLGRVLDGDHVLYLWGSVLKKKNALPKQRLVATIMSNLGFERAWEERGGLLDRTQVGDQHVHAAMLAKGAALGGEQSGHILSAANEFCGDGVLTALQIATLCNQNNLSLSEWLDQSFTAFPQKLTNVPIPSKAINRDWKNCNELKEAIHKAETSMGKEGRVLLRASGTEPIIRVMVEAIDPRIADNWSAHLAELVAHYLNSSD